MFYDGSEQRKVSSCLVLEALACPFPELAGGGIRNTQAPTVGLLSEDATRTGMRIARVLFLWQHTPDSDPRLGQNERAGKSLLLVPFLFFPPLSLSFLLPSPPPLSLSDLLPAPSRVLCCSFRRLHRDTRTCSRRCCNTLTASPTALLWA